MQSNKRLPVHFHSHFWLFLATTLFASFSKVICPTRKFFDPVRLVTTRSPRHRPPDHHPVGPAKSLKYLFPTNARFVGTTAPHARPVTTRTPRGRPWLRFSTVSLQKHADSLQNLFA